MACALIFAMLPVNVFAVESNAHDNDLIFTKNQINNIKMLDNN